jgi:hypothetical protein
LQFSIVYNCVLDELEGDAAEKAEICMEEAVLFSEYHSCERARKDNVTALHRCALGPAFIRQPRHAESWDPRERWRPDRSLQSPHFGIKYT